MLALISAGSGCGLILGLDDFEDAPASGGQSSGGDDATASCRPDMSEECYGGPSGTAGVGLCSSGIRTCDSSGEMWGACQDEVLPRQESCASTEDENCDGFDCTIWSRVGHATNPATRITSISANNKGNIFAAGEFKDTVQFGTDPLISANRIEDSNLDAFIASLDSTGNHRWSRQFGDEMNQAATSTCVDGSGNVIFAGINSGSINLGDRDIGAGIFVAKFDDNGSHVWSRGIHASPESESGLLTGNPKVSCTPDGDVFIAGGFAGTIQFDDVTFRTYPTDTYDIYIARMNGSTGSWSATDGGWSRRFGGPGNDSAADVATHSSGSAIITGTFTQGIEFGNFSSTVDDGMYLARIDSTGKPTWARSFTNARPSALSIDALGNTSITGTYEHPVDFGGGALPDWSQMTFAVQFDIAGIHRWSRGFLGQITMSSLSADPLNNVTLFGQASYSLRIDDNEVLTLGDFPSALAIKLSPEGRTIWKRWLPASSAHSVTSVVAETDLSGESIISGRVVYPGGATAATIDFGTGPQRTGEHSYFIAKLGN
ncbi:hypothetical protein [Sorangium cellulosum]|uniref:hypothetical protein n=1 Tax=Sorangium cellulosum TaxID=56 RepID=UPI0012DB28D9|nr:hypothetical protein [Sorangium cellulosum]